MAKIARFEFVLGMEEPAGGKLRVELEVGSAIEAQQLLAQLTQLITVVQVQRAAEQVPALAPDPQGKGAGVGVAPKKAKPTPDAPPADKPALKVVPKMDDVAAKIEAENPGSGDHREPEKNGAANGKAVGWDLAGDGAGDEPDDRFDLASPPGELVQAKRLKDVIIFLQDRGFRTEEQLVKACEKMKEKIPVLTRIVDIGDRVKIALDVLSHG